MVRARGTAAILWYAGGHGPGAAESHRIGYTGVGFLDQYLKTP
jgi:hypothetical protein